MKWSERFSKLNTTIEPLGHNGEDPPSHSLFDEMVDLPCSCGITHPYGCDTVERFDLLLGHIGERPMYKNTTRCKICKEPTMCGRKK